MIDQHPAVPKRQHALVKFKLRPGKFAVLEANLIDAQTQTAYATLAAMTEGEILVADVGPQTAAWFETVWKHRHANSLGRRETFWYYVKQFATRVDDRDLISLLLAHIKQGRLLQCPLHLQNTDTGTSLFLLLLPKAYSSLGQCVLLETFARARDQHIVMAEVVKKSGEQRCLIQ